MPSEVDLTRHPIALVVLPLKTEAISKAERAANDLVEKVTTELAAADNDLHRCAPYPAGGLAGLQHALTKGRYELFRRLTTWRADQHVTLTSPCYADIDRDLVEHFIGECKEDAATQYDGFVYKLIGKIGDVSAAELDGNHVWSFSVLTVTKADGTVERWKTQQITNVSKLGKLFNQWPTRKMR